MTGTTARAQVDWPPGGGEMGALIRAHDWAATPLGPASAWSPYLRAAVDLILPSPFPAVVLWGPDLIQLYNDGYRMLMGAKHPAGLGRPTRDCWPEIWSINAPIYARVWRGESVAREDAPYPIDRHGTPEEAWFALAHSPLRDDTGAIAGILVLVTETTARVLADRRRDETADDLRASNERQQFLLALGDQMRAAGNPDAVIAAATRALGERLGASRIVYAEIDEAAGLARIRVGWEAPGVPPHPPTLRLADFGGPLLEALRAGEIARFDDIGAAPTGRDDLAALDAITIRAGISVPLLIGGRFVMNLNVQQDRPRHWTDDEVALAAEVAERTWAAVERARAEADLRESEARYRAIFNSINEGFSLLEIQFDEWGNADDVIIRDANPAQNRIDGVRAQIGKRVREFLPDIEQKWIERYAAVARSGEPAHFEDWSAANGRWYEVDATRVGGPGSPLVAIVHNDVTARKRAEEVLRASEERHTFLLVLADALRPLGDPLVVQETAMRTLGEHLGVSRACYGEMQGDEDTLLIGPGYASDLPPLVGQVVFSAFDLDSMMATYRAGQTVVIHDRARDATLTPTAKAKLAAIGVQAAVGVPLIKGGRVRAILTIYQATPRTWTPTEVAILEEAVERTWAAAERTRAEAARRESEARGSALIANLPGGAAFIVDRDLRYRLAEGEALRAAGYAPADFIGKTVTEVAGPELAARQEPYYRRALAGESFTVEHGEAGRTYLTRGVPLRDTTGAIDSVLALSFDITERRRAEAALRTSEARFRGFAEASSDTLWIVDAGTGKLDYLSPAFERMFGAAREMIADKPGHWSALIHSDDRAAGDALLHRALAGEMATGDYRIIRPVDGETRWMRDTVFPIRDDAGIVRRAAGIVQDVTGDRRLQATLRASEAQFRAIANLVPDLLWSNDPHGGTDWYNARWLDYTGQSLAEATDSGWSAAIHPDDRSRSLAQFQAAIDGGTPLLQHHRIRRADGAYRWHLLRAEPLRDEAGEITSWYGAATDIHDLQRARQLAEDAVRGRDEFLATAAHELRTPLARLRLGSQLLQLTGALGEDERAEALAIIERGSQRLEVLVRDLVDLARLRTGQLTLAFAPVDLGDLVSEVVAESRARRRGAAVHHHGRARSAAGHRRCRSGDAGPHERPRQRGRLFARRRGGGSVGAGRR